jgi:hypothetical protein
VTDGTPKWQADRTVLEVDVLCAFAQMLVSSHMPIGLGKYWQKEQDELEFLLTEIPMRFKRAIERAQRKGWAAK